MLKNQIRVDVKVLDQSPDTWEALDRVWRLPESRDPEGEYHFNYELYAFDLDIIGNRLARLVEVIKLPGLKSTLRGDLALFRNELQEYVNKLGELEALCEDE